MYNRGMIELQQCTDQELWDDYALGNNAHPLQLWSWGQLKGSHGWSVDRFFAYDKDEKVVGGAQVLTRKLPLPLRAFSYIPRGPWGEEGIRDELLNALAENVKREYRSVALSVEPDVVEFNAPTGWVKSKNKILPARTIILDLEKTESELLSEMVKKTRQYIRKSAAEAIKIKQVRTLEDIERCLDVYRQTSKRAHFDLHDDRYYLDVFNIMGEHSPVFAAYVDEQPIAFLWLAVSADTVFELYGGMNDLGQQLRANYALKWHAIRKCKQWGLSRYDFGGLIGDGVTTFKKGWTSDETELSGTFDKPLSSFYTIWNNGLPAAKTAIRKIKSLCK